MFAFARKVHLFYAFILSTIFIGSMASLFYLWAGGRGPIQMDGIFSMVEASMKLERLKEGNQLDRVHDAAQSDRSRQALQLLKNWERQTGQIHRVHPDKSYNSYEQSLSKTYKSLEQMISLPKANKIIGVLNEKVESFRGFVVQNNWRTLTRISGRTLARLDGQKTRKDSFYAHESLKELNQKIQSDIQEMRRVTMNSILSQADKNRILNRLDSLKTELGMLSSYTVNLKSFTKNFSKLKSMFSAWMSTISPEISLKMIDIERIGNFIFFAILGLSVFVFFSLIGGMTAYSKSKEASQDRAENIALQVIRDGIIPFQDQLPESFSKGFKDELEKYREYVHKRMSFGTVFQEAIPFSTMMLDSNLNVVWGNDLFYEVWGLEEKKSAGDSISWDFLQQFTNLGENDPVVTALNEGVAGIYQIQVRAGEESEGWPYEMYVAPVDYAGQSRIMIFFYPLSSIQETITHQIRSIVGPVGRTLDALAEQRFTGKEFESLKKDFEIAGIENLFDKFCSYDVEVTQQKKDLLTEIAQLEGRLEEQFQLVNDVEENCEKKVQSAKRIMESFDKMKESLIRFSGDREELENSLHSITDKGREVFRAEKDLFDVTRRLEGVLTENMKTYESILAQAKEFKDVRSDLDDSRSRLMQTLEQTMVFQRMSGTDTKLEQSLHKIKSEVKAFDQSLASLSKAATNVDVALSKMGHQLQDVEVPDLKEKEQWFGHMKEHFESDMYSVEKRESESRQTDENLINNLYELFASFRELKGALVSSREVLATLSSKRVDFEDARQTKETESAFEDEETVARLQA